MTAFVLAADSMKAKVFKALTSFIENQENSGLEKRLKDG
jgi:hypothetical protein